VAAAEGPVRVALEIAAPAEHVWAWLTEPALIPRWFGWEHDGLEQEIDLIFLDGVARSRQLLRFETNGAGLLRLEDLGERTWLTLSRRPEEREDPDAPFDGVDEGWTTFLQTLRLGVERHRDEERRVLQFQGPHRDADAPSTAEALGLAAATTLPVGARYAATTPSGEELAGEVWFRSAHQLGLTVEGWGDGLLVVVERPPDDARPHGGGQLFLSSYGQDPAAYAAHFERWTAWTRRAFAG
jgi:hypothetical protein